MQSATKFEVSTCKQHAQIKQTTDWIYAVQLNDGRIVIGQAVNAAKAIATINGGGTRLIPKAFQVFRILGVKEVSEERTLPGVVAQFCRDFGEDQVVCV